MATLLKFLFISIVIIAYQPLFSSENEKCCSQKKEDRYKKYLKNTVWIVPPNTLLAYEYDSGIKIPVSDQTVWVIEDYVQGYFFGSSYTSLDKVPSSQRKILGTITPNGDVYIAFYPLTGDTQSTDIVNGIGTFKKYKGSYRFIMQMNSAPNSTNGLSHWSYMISVKPGDYLYQHLPGVNISVPEFISQF